MKERAIIVDLDGTLADIKVRLKFLENGKNDWKNFQASVKTDTLNHWCRELIEHMKSDYRVLLVSGRIESLREGTEEWLRLHKVFYDRLFMRPVNDYRPDQILKLEMYQQKILNSYEILFVVDDRSKVVEMWRSQGLICLQCQAGNY